MKESIRKIFQRNYTVPAIEKMERTSKNFSPVEKFISICLALILLISAASLLQRVNALFLSEIPAPGGELREGIIGSPRFINPLLSLSSADRDLTTLVYSGLLKATTDGELIPDLAERYDISEDGLNYTFYLRENAEFHDGGQVTADDVLFTISKAQDPALKSPKRANWEGVSAEKIDEKTVRLILKQPYAPFLENATLGILPKRLWKDADAEQFPFSPRNLEAIGSGPYKIERIKRNDSGIPMYIELSAFSDHVLGKPYISRLFIRFYSNEKDLLADFSKGEIRSLNAITPNNAKELETKGIRIERSPLPRIFGVFFNQNQSPVLADKSVRKALELATDKQAVVDSVLSGYGLPIDGPVPPLLLDSLSADASEAKISEAEALLDKAKWIKNEATGIREKTKGKNTEKLSFSLVTSDVPELRDSAEMLKETWSKIGAEVRVQIFESGDLNQNVIRPRKFDTLLFGEIIGRDMDLFAFWHSSQRNDPGLNIAMYTNSKVDKLLESARKTSDREKRNADYASAVKLITEETPAIFLYSPDFIYILPENIKGYGKGITTIPSERFLNITEWYVNTEKVWNIFTK